MPDAPTGTVTFLFTDLESSTRSWEEHPQAMQDALARHDEILRRAVDSHSGYVVKTTGDGVHAAFPTARSALDAAVDAQLALTAEPWPSTGPLKVRMGIHTGEAEMRDGDYYGTALNRAARIMGAGHGDQILMSRATEELVHDALPDGCELVSLGEHRLRDLGRPETLLQLTHPGLPRSFPPPRSVDAFPGNLPPQLTSFVGRADEMERVATTLAEARLVTLTGVGGVGKTRLALQVAGEVLPDFRHGAWFCALGSGADPDALIQVVATALNVQPHPTIPLDQRVLDAFREREALVVLDNCEHLLDAASDFTDALLRECPQVRVIATSREPLDLDGERVVRVRSLSVPEDAGNESSEAVQLFVERARTVDADYDADRDLGVVGEICRRLDGIPLAIELAAARVVAMSPAEIAELLDERFRLLTGGRRSSVERHQTLRATVDWSYSLLSPTERAVFDRLGVFPGSFNAAAARAVAGGAGVEDWDVRDALTGLVSKSMVNTTSGADTTRYALLETMRQYARERLDADGDADRCRRAHAEHFAAVAQAVGNAFLTGEDLNRRSTESRLEIDNYRAAVTWALDSAEPGDADLALRIAVQFAGTDTGARRAIGLMSQRDRLLERAMESSPELHAGVLAGMANDALFSAGDIEGAAALARRALELGPSVTGALAMAHGALSYSALADGDFEQAVDVLRQGQARVGDASHGRSFYEVLLARAEAARGNTQAARQHAEAAVRLARQSEFQFRLSQALSSLSGTYRYDDLDTARQHSEEAAEAARDSQIGIVMSLQAELAHLAGDTDAALGYMYETSDRWLADTNAITVVVTAARASSIFSTAGDLIASATLGGAAEHGPYARLLPMGFDQRGRDELGASLQQVRLRLGDEAFDTAYGRGTRLTADEIVEVVRDAARELLAQRAELSDRLRA